MKLAHTFTACLFFVALYFVAALPAFAGEINYGTIADVQGSNVLLDYKSPGGERFFVCSLSGSCTSASSTSLSPALLGINSYTKSPDGRYGVRQFTLGTVAYYILFDLTQNPPKKVSIIPFLTPASMIKFSPSGNQVIFIATNGLIARYDVSTGKLNTTTITQTELPLLSISQNGTYLSAYNYVDAVHRIWRLGDGTLYQIPSTVPSYVEFSADETQAAYLSSVGGFKTLFVLPTNSLAAPNARQITKPNAVVEDYLFIGNTLYYLSNPEHPLSWNVYQYTSDGNKVTLIEKDVSYGDYLKNVNGKLAYIKVEGKNANVKVYDPSSSKSTTLAPLPASPRASNISSTAVYYAGRYGVLISPTQTSSSRSKRTSQKKDLFVWLHGGPQRQVAIGYHPYLSYAVYDELLERLASGGNYVLKLDYTGSTGYGSGFENALHKNIGIADVNDVEQAVVAFKKDHNVDHVYLIGNSYGGYLALKTITHAPSVVTGAISINGVTDWYGLITRIPSSPFKDLFDGVPDLNNLDAYMRASVFTDIPKLTDDHKVLVAYAENDATVPTWQSTQYMEYAKSKNINADVITFPGEDHVLRKRETLDNLCSKITSFFALKGVSCSL
jgi:dipeptidyl aminopeptidase/acylaminoacyl peptidase